MIRTSMPLAPLAKFSLQKSHAVQAVLEQAVHVFELRLTAEAKAGEISVG